MTHNPNIIWHPAAISKSDRQSLNGHKSCVLWFTGLSGSGKSVLANAVDEKLYRKGIQSYVLDGDNIRHGLNKDLGFQTGDRIENIRRIGEVAKLFVDSGQMILTAFISPFREDRDMVRALFPKGEFFEIYVKCPLHVCEQRDPKGLYKKARNGEIKHFTGIDSPYEAPLSPDFIIESDQTSISDGADLIINALQNRGII
ncbi:adenylyl-sulfate kinase [Bacillus subtilis]|mgnify:CR=1 FL=1|jgi:adenylylsulfate kinase|uniref:Probable adenylyl-sulfate kinase n=4 Tax=Bacillales TaxID=1385 RepID=CYSC2_BACSU|nr:MULTISPECIES: adenylyl-sulfate kinase [Bacillales]NP_388972.1 putative adenylylsulfate kinase [Bacillus subtilis subsp. subtilis str. 168]O06735.2 RecName: Full=Probable adenylyl-sulfate kinase; AltName: Full=APS kinase; AltName: Full=ATP adenosine-5'-phosphosulfate 3'-phosphotransferase; AltName: Full=Adenosine-5'-phosphosulfate kinase [Bacillus subtilis subsp. subtilis str. 168]AOL32859.1 adenylyl-sulfate kinase [Alkalicoccobacillus gibsonii]AXC52372.1 adenylyl-sulfate kinase [Bacillus spi